MATSSIGVASRAASFVERANNETINFIVDGYLDGKETVKKNPLLMYVALSEAYNGDMDAFPRPGSKQGDAVGGNNPDHYDDVRNGEKVKGTYTADFAMSTDKGQVIAEELSNWKKAKDTSNPIPEKYRNHSSDKIDREIKKWSARKTAIVALYRTAINVHWQMTDINELAGIHCDYSTDEVMENGEKVVRLTDTVYPMFIYDDSDMPKSALKHWKNLSVGAFLALDVPEAKRRIDEEKKTAWDAVINSSQRQGGNGQGAAEKMVTAKFKTQEEFHTGLAAVANAFDDKAMLQTIYKALSSKDNDYIVQSLGDLYIALRTNLWPKIQAKYEKINETKVTDNEAKEAKAS